MSLLAARIFSIFIPEPPTAGRISVAAKVDYPFDCGADGAAFSKTPSAVSYKNFYKQSARERVSPGTSVFNSAERYCIFNLKNCAGSEAPTGIAFENAPLLSSTPFV